MTALVQASFLEIPADFSRALMLRNLQHDAVPALFTVKPDGYSVSSSAGIARTGIALEPRSRRSSVHFGNKNVVRILAPIEDVYVLVVKVVRAAAWAKQINGLTARIIHRNHLRTSHRHLHVRGFKMTPAVLADKA